MLFKNRKYFSNTFLFQAAVSGKEGGNSNQESQTKPKAYLHNKCSKSVLPEIEVKETVATDKVK